MRKEMGLGEVATFIRGINFKPDDVVPLGTDGSVACFRTKNVQGELDFNDVWGVDQRFVKRDEQFLRTGDILVSTANSAPLVGRCSWVPELPWRASFGGFISVLRPNQERVDARYLYRWFSSNRIQAKVRSFGRQTTNISNLNLERCLRLPLELPPIMEQRHIAEVLDRADALRAKRRAAMAHLESLKQSIFVDMFGDPETNPMGWPRKTMGAISSKFSDGPFGSNLKTSHYVERGVRVVRLQNIGVGTFIDSDKAYISENHFTSLKKHECLPGDVLVGTLGDPNLRACIQPPRLKRALNKADCVQIRPNDEQASAAYVCALLNLPSTERMAQELIHGQTRLRISMGRLRNLEVPVPPRELQEEFADRLAAIGVSRETMDHSENQLDRLFLALQQRAFAGEL